MTRVISVKNGKLNTCGHSTEQGGGCKFLKRQDVQAHLDNLHLCTCEYSTEFSHFISPSHPWCTMFEVDINHDSKHF